MPRWYHLFDEDDVNYENASDDGPLEVIAAKDWKYKVGDTIHGKYIVTEIEHSSESIVKVKVYNMRTGYLYVFVGLWIAVMLGLMSTLAVIYN